MAIAATVNLGLVLFDLSYVPWRDFYLRNFPGFTLNFPSLTPLHTPGFRLSFPSLSSVYDPIKGIEPHRETEKYLKTVNALARQVSQTGLQSPQTQALLAELRRLSNDMIETNPFGLANKTGTLEKIKNRMRDRLGVESSRTAFNIFWSQAHQSQAGWQQEIEFFNQRIRPLIATNYYRTIGENGEFTDEFWRIDIWFIAVFGLEFLVRTFFISRRHVGIRWLDAMLWRWYDIFLLIPFELLPFLRWTWLRIIPVTLRLNRAELIALDRVEQQISQGIVASLAEELTEVVIVRVINQIQGSIQRGDFTNWLFQSANRKPYIDINDINEVEAIAGLMVNLIVYQVLPQIQPDIIAILRHNIESVLNHSPLYRGVQNLPGLGNVPQELSEQLAGSIAQNLYNAIVAAVEDPVGAKISSQLVQHFSAALGEQVQDKHTLERIRELLGDFLEEVKLNYIKRLAQEDVEQIMEQTRKLRQQALEERLKAEG
jgi:hypothetical protein